MAAKTIRKPEPALHARLLQHPFFTRHFPLIQEDLTATYSRHLTKWLWIAPVIGLTTGLLATAISIIILDKLWPFILHFFLRDPWTIVPVITAAFAVTGLIMQYMTPDPDQHSTEEVMHSYHEHQGDIDVRCFVPKIVAAITTVGFGGSAALEGPAIYGGGAIGSWFWKKLRKFRLDRRDRRIMLISGAAAGMGAVFRAPMTGLVFALEMPYKDDLAHEALLPSLIASVVAYVTLAFFLGASPLFNFATSRSFTGRDLLWCAVLGVFMGLAAMVFNITFRRVRTFMVHWSIPHWLKLTLGGFFTGLCGLGFLLLYHGSLVPLGPNYEAVGEILNKHHGTLELIVFGVLKLGATLFTLGTGGVSAMFVPLFLSGGSFGAAFAQFIHSNAVDLYAAVGMAAFISAGYKTPLAAVVFVAEATGGHAFIIPSVIGAAIAYAVSGESSASGSQRRHEIVWVQELKHTKVGEVMQTQVVSVLASSTLDDFADNVCARQRHTAFPVLADDRSRVLGVIAVSDLGQIPPEEWASRTVLEIADRKISKIRPNTEVMEALRMLLKARRNHMLLVTATGGELKGVLTKTDLLKALEASGGTWTDGSMKEPGRALAEPQGSTETPASVTVTEAS